MRNVLLQLLLLIIMTPTFCCGFECGQLGSAGQHWPSATGISVSTTTVRGAGRSLRVNPSAAAPNTAFGNSIAVLGLNVSVIRLYIRFATLPSADTLLAWLGTSNAGIAFKQSDSKIYCAVGSTPVFGASGVSVTTGVWYRIDLKVNQNGGTGTGTVDAKVDGTALGQKTWSLVGAGTTFVIGASATCSGDWFYDDIVGGTTSADYPIGAGHVDNFIPASDGTHTSTSTNIVKGTAAAPTGGGSITSATTDAFNWVNAQPLGGGATDNTRLINQQTASSAQYVEVVFGPGTGVSTPTSAPRAVEVIAEHKQAATQACDFKIKINDNGTEADVVNLGNGAGVTTDRFGRAHFATAPTGGAWTVVSGAGNFNNLKARFGYSADATPDVYWRGIMVEAEFADASGSNFTQSLAGSIGPSGAIVKTINSPKGGSISPSSVIKRDVTTSKAGSITPAGAIAKFVARALAGQISPSAAVTAAHLFFKSVAGSISPSAVIKRDAVKPLGGQTSPAGTIAKAGTRNLAGQTSPSSAIAKLASKIFTGSISPTAAIATARNYARSLAGQISPSSVITRAAAKALSGTSSPIGAIKKDASKKLTGSVSPSAAIQTLKTKLLSVAGSVSPIGTVVRAATKLASGAISPIGSLVKAVTHTLSGATSPSGAVQTLKAKFVSLSGSTSPAATIVKSVSKPAAGNTSPAGSIVKAASRKLTGSLSPSGSVVTLKTKLFSVAGSISPSAAIKKAVSRILAGSSQPSGAMTRSAARSATGSTSPAGTLQTLKQAFRNLAGQTSPAGSVRRNASKSLAGSVSPIGDFARSISKSLGGFIDAIGNAVTRFFQGGVVTKIDVTVAAFTVGNVELSAAPLTSLNVSASRLGNVELRASTV